MKKKKKYIYIKYVYRPLNKRPRLQLLIGPVLCTFTCAL